MRKLRERKILHVAAAPAPRTWENSIAVLPFQNMSGDEDQEYFSDGLTEELINALANIEDLRVVARTSSFALAHAGLSDTYAVAPASGTLPTPVAKVLAKEHALRAVQLDDQLEEAQVALGNVMVTEFAWEEALDPFALNAVRNLGRLYYFTGEYEPAVEILNEVLHSNPNFSFVHMILALVYLEQGKYAEAKAAIEQEEAIQDSGVPMLECITGIRASGSASSTSIRCLPECETTRGSAP
jgi:tetratricopeptide (TPR) repeat protein